jgi:hypothetical protein
MSPGFVRIGGICAFLVIAVMVIGTFVVAGMAVDAARSGGAAAASGGVQIGSVIIGLVIYICLILTVWTSKGLFNSFGYNGGNTPVMIIIAMIVVGFILSFIGGAGVTQMTTPSAMSGTGNTMGIISFIVSLVMFIGFIWFAMSCFGFGGKAKMGLWKAIGILYLIMGACFAIMMAIMIIMVATKTLSAGMASFAGVLALIGMLVGLAALICHGIGLLLGAGRMGGQTA